MAGYDLIAKRSGKSSDKATPVISKKGSNALRYALYQPALIASARNSNFINILPIHLEEEKKSEE